MKKLILSLTLLAFISAGICAHAATVSDSEIRATVLKYKAKNYVGCLQDTQDMLRKDPTNAFAYYYQGLAYMQLGKPLQAKDAYEKVIKLSNSAILMENSEKALKCLNDISKCSAKDVDDTELDKFIRTTRFLGNSVQADVNKKRLEQDRQEMNKDLYEPKSEYNKSEMPTNDEIAEAVKTLAKIGLNPLAGMNNSAMYPQYNAQSNEMMQMNMLMGNNNNNNNSMNNMLPFLMMGQGQGGNNMSPEIIQTMMMSNMASDFGFSNQTY